MTGLSGGKTTLRDDRALLSPVGLQLLYLIRQECLSEESGGNGKRMSWHVDCCCSRVDMCLDKRANVFLKAIYLSLSAESQPCHKERQVFSVGEISFKGFNGKTYSYQTEISFNCFEMSSWCLSSCLPEKEEKNQFNKGNICKTNLVQMFCTHH